jgi:hypothetical protein
MSDEPIPVDDWPKSMSPEEMLEYRREYFHDSFKSAIKTVPGDLRMWITIERHQEVFECYVFDRDYSTEKPRYIVGMKIEDMGRLATCLLHQGYSFRGMSEEEVDDYVDGKYIDRYNEPDGD